MKLFAVLGLFISSISFSQLDVSWTDAVSYTKGNVVKTLPNSEHSFYVVTATGNATKGIRFLFYDKGVVRYENTLNPGNSMSIQSYNDAFLLNGKLFVFFSKETSSSNILMAQEIGPDCQSVGSPILVKEQTINTKLNTKGFQYYIKVSPDNKHLSVSYMYDNENVLKPPYLTCSIYDETLKELHSESIELPYYLSETSLEDITVTNYGTTLILISGFKRPSKVKATYNSLDLYKITTSGLSTTSLISGSYSFFNATIQNQDNNIYSIAYQYNVILDRKVNPGSQGVFYYNYFADKDSLSEREELEFDKQLLLKRLSPKERKRYDKAKSRGSIYNLALQDFKLTNLITLKDSSLVMTLEEKWEEVRTYQEGRINTYHTFYYFNNLMFLKFDAQKVRTFTTIIPKFQASMDDGGIYSSIIQYQKPNDTSLYLLFNDELENYSSTGEYIAGDYPQNFTRKLNRFCIAQVKLDLQTGEYTRHPVLDREDTERLLIPKASEIYKLEDLLLVFNRKDKFQFGWLKL